MPSYIPSRDANLAAFADTFDTTIGVNPAVYLLTPADSVTIHTYVQAYLDAFAVVSDPATKTKPSVAAKDGAKAAMLDIIRPYAQTIRLSSGITNENKLAIGINPADRNPTPIPVPASNPLLAVIAATPGVQTLRFADSNTPDRRAKPFGAIGMQLFVAVGDAPAIDPAQAQFAAFVTRQPFGVDFVPSQNGKTATYFGRWQTRTGLVGPWSPAVSFTVAA